MGTWLQTIERALEAEVERASDAGFQRGCERGRFEERLDLRPKLDRLEKVEKLLERAAKFVTEQERLNHTTDCPGRRGWSSLCRCTAGYDRMGDFFDLMGDLNAAVEEVKPKLAPKPSCICRYSLTCQACGTTGP